MNRFTSNLILETESYSDRPGFCKQCGKNLRVVRKDNLVENQDGAFCCHTCSEIYRAEHDSSTLLRRMVNGMADPE